MPPFAELYQSIHAQLFDIDRIPVALTAIVLCGVLGMVTGPLKGNAGPFAWLVWDGALARIGDRLNNKKRPRADLLFRGFLVSAVAVFLAVAAGKAAQAVPGAYDPYALLDVLLVALCLSGGAVWYALLRLYFALGKGQVSPGAYYAIARSTRADLNSTDTYGITRTAMALAARSFDKGLVGPVLWYLIGGLPFLFAYATLAALAWRFGQDGFTKGFGDVPLALEKLFGFVPSVLAALLMTAASTLTPTAGIVRSVVSWFSHKNAAPYAEGGMPLTAMAFALNISLGGPVQDLKGSTLKNQWVGPEGASAKVEPHHLKRGIYISVMAHILLIAALLGAYVWGHSLPLPPLVPDFVDM